VDRLTVAAALDAVEALVDASAGGTVLCANAHHVAACERQPALREAFAAASLCLAAGTPVVWAARLLGRPVPERVSGADLLLPLLGRAQARRWRVSLCVEGGPEAAARAEALLRSLGVHVVEAGGGPGEGAAAGAGQGEAEAAVVARIAASAPDLVLVGLGAPAQELFIHRCTAGLAPAVVVAVGPSLRYVLGQARRAPSWMSRAGLEWLHRLAQEPRRLWRRYLLSGPRFLGILARELAALRRRPLPAPRPP
jgi:N-acetylglucosaminyldiphosphoundecaprenol N-acetyl-beta-D-mannosaminyltransferase